MADVTLNITIPDAWVQRVQQALGVSTKDQAQDWIRQRIKERVLAHEGEQAHVSAQQAVDDAITSQQTAVTSAQENVNELTLT